MKKLYTFAALAILRAAWSSQHQFTADAPNRRWAGDTTEFAIGDTGKLYLAVVMDLVSRFCE